MGFQSIDKCFFMESPPISVQYSSTETCFKEKQSTVVFHESFSNEDCRIGSFQIISIFIIFWSLTKISEGCLWINLVDFLSKEPFFCIAFVWNGLLQLFRQWSDFSFFFTRDEGSFHRYYFVGKNFHEISMDEFQFDWFQIDSIDFQGLSSNWDYFHEILINETNY